MSRTPVNKGPCTGRCETPGCEKNKEESVVYWSDELERWQCITCRFAPKGREQKQ
jgi:hypothetical protein